jgi:hypothetical protein
MGTEGGSLGTRIEGYGTSKLNNNIDSIAAATYRDLRNLKTEWLEGRV